MLQVGTSTPNEDDKLQSVPYCFRLLLSLLNTSEDPPALQLPPVDDADSRANLLHLARRQYVSPLVYKRLVDSNHGFPAKLWKRSGGITRETRCGICS